MSTKTVQTDNPKTANADTTPKSHRLDWIIFAVSLVVTIGFLIVDPTWFWVTLPFVLTYFVKAIDYM